MLNNTFLHSKYYYVSIYLVCSILQSFQYVKLILNYDVHPVILFCYISMAISTFYLSQHKITFTYKNYKIALTIIIYSGITNILNTLPRTIPGINYSSYNVIAKSDVIISFVYSFFVFKNIKFIDICSTILIFGGMVCYYFNSMAINISMAALAIVLSKIGLEQSLSLEKYCIQHKIFSPEEILILSNSIYPIVFVGYAIFFPEIIANLITHMDTFCLTFLLFIHNDVFSIMSVYICCNEKTQTFLSIGLLWVILLKVKMECHRFKVTNLNFAGLSSVIFIFRVFMQSPINILNICAITMICIGTVLPISLQQ